ncbi:MAG: DUF4383 domain-containing protein [Burkholderiales bacterium]
MTSRNFAIVIGIAYLAAGVLGFVPALLSTPPAGAPQVSITAFYGYLLGLFPVNFVHNLMHLAIGAWGVAAARTAGGARAFAKTLTVIYGALAVLGLFPTLNTLFGLVPIHGHDVWLHAGTAIVAAYFGWFSVGRTETTAGSKAAAQ